MSPVLRSSTRMLAGAGMALTLLFAAACDDDDDPFVPVATELQVTAGNNQTVAMNAESQPLTVTLLDQNDDPIANRTVTWTVTSGTGTVESSTSTTNAQGVASMTFTAGATPGAVVVTASVAGVTAPATFSLMVQ